MLSYTYGTYTSSLPTHQTVPTRAAWQCDYSKHTGAQRYFVRRRTRLQVARVAESFWQLAHHLHAHEPLGQERSAQPSVRTASAKGDCEGHHRGSFTGQHLRQGASRRHGRGQKNGPQSIGKSRGGWTTKLHMVAADDRTPLAFSLSPGQAHDGPEGRKPQPVGATTRESASGDGSRIFGRPNTPIGVRYGVHACCSTPEKSRGPLGV